MWRHLAARKSQPGNPIDGLALPGSPEGRDRYATPDEATTLLAVLPRADQAIWGTDRWIGVVQRANAIRDGAPKEDGVDPERADLDDRVQAFMADGGETDYAVALARLLDLTQQPQEAPDGVDGQRFDLHQRVLANSIEQDVDYPTALVRVLAAL
jgi:hypothetical protein